MAVVAAAARAGKELIDTMSKPIPADPPRETAAQLRERRAALLEQIEAATKAIAEARSDYEKAFAAFADVESEDSGKTLWLAEQRTKARERKLQELHQQLEANEGAVKVAERSELEQRDRDIDAELTDNRRAAELDAAAARAAASLVDALLKVRAHNVHREKLRNEQQGVREKLGAQREFQAIYQNVEASLVNTAAGLRDLANIEQDPVRRGYLVSLSMGRVDFLPQTA
jgi:DNA repair exonuclease SbcCD ATPase subunit